jgi:2-keto-4-pentenoate hydratase
MREQRSRRVEALSPGARQIGWKLGVGDRERIGGSIAVGYLTSATLIDPDGRFGRIGDDLHADVELAVLLQSELKDGAVLDAIDHYATALEIVDLATVFETPEAIVAGNVFHRGVAFGSSSPTRPDPVRATVRVNGEVRAEAEAQDELEERLLAADRVLESIGERLRPGDWIITGSIVQVPVNGGNVVEAEIEGLDSVGLIV